MCKKIIIIGGGVGGLALAVELLHRGYSVTIMEKESSLGGKVNKICYKDSKFDTTASILMTPKSYTRIFTDVGEDYKDYFNLKPLEPMYRVFYDDGDVYDYFSDDKKMRKSLDNMDESVYSDYKRFIDKTIKKHGIMKESFLDSPMENITDMISINKIIKMIKLNPIASCDKYIKSFIKDKKLREYLLFQCMYMGVDPYKSSNLYCTIPAITYNFGLWYIEGGMYKYIESLENVIHKLGGEIKKQTTVNEVLISDSKAVGVRCGTHYYESDAVVCNVDFPYAIKNIINDSVKERKYNKKTVDDMDYSFGTIILYLKLDIKYRDLAVHNIVFGSNFKGEMNDIDEGRLQEDMSMYIYYPSAIDDTVCKSGSIMNIMVRVPNNKLMRANGKEYDKNIISKFRNKIIENLKKKTVFSDIDNHIEHEDIFTPVDMENVFNAYAGSSFGLSHTIFQSLYFRPPMKSESLHDLYYVGSSVHPGNGVSIILDGVSVLVDLIDNDLKKK